jgi:hypothetical protein
VVSRRCEWCGGGSRRVFPREAVVLGPRNAGLANSTKHKPSDGGRVGDGGEDDGGSGGGGGGSVSELLCRGGEVREVR